jgi:hypothetical protein
MQMAVTTSVMYYPCFANCSVVKTFAFEHGVCIQIQSKGTVFTKT